MISISRPWWPSDRTYTEILLVQWRGRGVKMKTVVITTPGGPEVLEIQERSVPVPGKGEIRAGEECDLVTGG